MPEQSTKPGPFISSLINASVGNSKNFRTAFWGQAIIGFLYSFGYFDFWLVGLIIGYILPIIWVICTYRLLKIKSLENESIPFPRWMKKDPGNALVIFIDIFFLTFIWYVILSGLYNPVWIKVVFTMAFPLLTLAMLRNIFLFTPAEKEKDSGE